jgi:hypothetical protein
VVAPLVVTVPHDLGREEAIRRLKTGLAGLPTQWGKWFQVNEEVWSGAQLAFRITAMKQQASGTIDVADNHVRIEIMLPWLLARIASGLQGKIQKQGTLMLEKK